MSPSNVSRKTFLKLAAGAVGIGGLSYFLGLGEQLRVRTNQPGDDAPDYLDGDLAFPVFRGPYLQKDVQLAACLFPAEMAALKMLCDQTLNAVPQAPFEYVPLIPGVLVIYANMLVSSLDERDAQVGMIPETEVGFWVLTVARQRTSLGMMPHHLAWWIPYLFVDESNSIAVGREVYGFNKQAAHFDKAPTVQSPQFSMDVLGFQRFAPDAIAQKERLLDLTSAAPQTAQSRWRDRQSAQQDLYQALLSMAQSNEDPSIVAFAARAALQNIPLVFIKQLRHAAQTRKAAYQTIVEAPMHIQTVHDGGFFSQPHQMKLHPLASHPLAQKLGLQEDQSSNLGAWLRVDFTLEDGVEYTFM